MKSQSYFGMNLYQMIAFLWKQSWKNSKQDGKNHVITFLCAQVILLRYVLAENNTNEEQTRLVAYLASDESHFTSGEVTTWDWQRMNLYQMIASLWKQSWKNSKRDGKNHVITFLCALVILLRYVFSHSQTFTSHQYT